MSKSSTTAEYLTTHKVAKLMGVSLPTVVTWVNAGKLAAHRTPGGHRRIAAPDLVRFAREYNYPLSEDFLRMVDPVPRVLVVDDDQAFCEMVRDYLEMKGSFRVEIANSGFAAGMIVARFRPDLILMDIMMPDMDGFQVLATLRESAENRSTPVLACTAYRDPELDERIARESFDGFLQKPLRLDHLLDVVSRKLKLSEAAS
jgi:excisionase family DNA binding protein